MSRKVNLKETKELTPLEKIYKHLASRIKDKEISERVADWEGDKERLYKQLEEVHTNLTNIKDIIDTTARLRMLFESQGVDHQELVKLHYKMIAKQKEFLSEYGDLNTHYKQTIKGIKSHQEASRKRLFEIWSIAKLFGETKTWFQWRETYKDVYI
jgi:hypothetical protein